MKLHVLIPALLLLLCAAVNAAAQSDQDCSQVKQHDSQQAHTECIKEDKEMGLEEGDLCNTIEACVAESSK